MKIKELPERLKDLAIMYMKEQGKKVTEDTTVRDMGWGYKKHKDLWCTIELYSEGHLFMVCKESLQQLRTIYPNDQEFGAVVAKLFLPLTSDEHARLRELKTQIKNYINE
jgi:hypothetical protein